MPTYRPPEAEGAPAVGGADGPRASFAAQHQPQASRGQPLTFAGGADGASPASGPSREDPGSARRSSCGSAGGDSAGRGTEGESHDDEDEAAEAEGADVAEGRDCFLQPFPRRGGGSRIRMTRPSAYTVGTRESVSSTMTDMEGFVTPRFSVGSMVTATGPGGLGGGRMYRPHTDSEVSTSSAQAAMVANRPSYTATATRGLGGMIGAASAAGSLGSSAGKKGPVPPSGPKPAGYTVSRGSSPTMGEATGAGDVAAPRAAAAAAAAVSAVSPSPPSYRVPPPPPPPQGSRSQSPAAGVAGEPGGGGTERTAASDGAGTLQDAPAAGLRRVSARSSTGPFRSKAPPPAPVRPVSQQSDGISLAGSMLSRPSSVALNFRRSNHAATLSSLGCAYDSSDSEDGGGPDEDEAGSGAIAAVGTARSSGATDGESSAGDGTAMSGAASAVNSLSPSGRGNPPPPLNRGPSARLLIDREEDWRGGPAQASSPMASVAAARAAIPSLVSVSRGLQERAAPIVAAKAAVGAHLQARFPAKSAAARLQGMQADSGHSASCAATEASTASPRSDPCVCRGGAAASAATSFDCVCAGGSELASRSTSLVAATRDAPQQKEADGVSPPPPPIVPKPPPRRNTLTGSLSRPEAEGVAAAPSSGEMLPSSGAASADERSLSLTGSS